MDRIEDDTLEARCQLTWDRICRNPDAFTQTAEDAKDEEDDTSDCYAVVSVYSDASSESPDMSLWANEPVSIGLEAADLSEYATDPRRHWELLDSAIGRLLGCSIPSWRKSETQTVRNAITIIKNLPRSSLPLSSVLWSTFDTSTSHYVHESRGTWPSGPENGTVIESSWERHKVTTIPDSNTIKLALATAYLQQTSHRGVSSAMTDYVNMLSNLLDTMATFEASQAATTQPEPPDSSLRIHSCQVARAFVWSAWQRSLQISSYYFFGTRLRRECNLEDWHPISPHPYEELKFSATGNSLKTEVQADKACSYLCRHSLDLVKLSSPSTHDFRALISHYNNQLGDREARCYQEFSEWHHCEPSAAFCSRGIESAPEDQSAHDQACTGDCQRIQWDKLSYLCAPAPRSLDLSVNLPRGGALRYQRATDRTLAISHVWSHGQGGRPEEGFNECLHRRYSAIAADLGCDSYWIDAACIPSDDGLRADAIKTINPIFRDSKVTLICDRDIMSIDIQDMSRQRCEALVSVLLLSDWNTRAWTLLEAIRGNRAIHLMCKGNNIVPLRDVLSILYDQGSVDLCGLLLGSPHLLPMGEEIYKVGLERAGVLLSRRFTSRRGDDIIIWSLLCGGDEAHSVPERFWKSRLRTPISSGFLMSTCERVKGVEGLSWAPSTAFADPLVAARSHSKKVSASERRVYWPHDGASTVAATLLREAGKHCNTALHLRGNWFVHLVQTSDMKQYSAAPGSCWERAGQLLSTGDYKRVIFIRPCLPWNYSMEAGAPFTPPQHLDNGKGAPVAVCATRDDRETFDVVRLTTELQETNELWGEEWIWKGVYTVAPEESISTSSFQIRILRIV